MLENQRIAVLLPAYNAEATLERTYREIPRTVVDEVVLVDDGSSDATARISRDLGIETICHAHNLGYGANQKTCYRHALALSADVFVMLHPDYQYSPRLIPAMAAMIVSGEFDLVLGSRILGGTALKGGMPVHKYGANRFLTWFENLCTGAKLSEYHTGFRAFSRRVLEELPLESNSNDFVFDNQILVQALHFGFRVGEISCPTRYNSDASTINFRRSIVYGLGVMGCSLQYRIQRTGLWSFPVFDPAGKLEPRLNGLSEIGGGHHE